MKGEIAMDKNVKILFRTTPEEKKLIEQKAKKLQMNISEYIRYSTLKNTALNNHPLYDQCVKDFLFHLDNILAYLQNINEATLDTNTLDATFNFFYEEGKQLWLCLRSQRKTTDQNKTSQI